jgi:hypothetical protein
MHRPELNRERERQLRERHLELYRLAQRVTDRFLGVGTYVRLNGFDPSRGEMGRPRKSQHILFSSRKIAQCRA